MTSELQRIAHGLLQYLDANPRLSADLKGAAIQCRELAGAVGELRTLIPAAAASAYHLDAAARACDQAAQLATQATATGRSWASSTVRSGGGGGRGAAPGAQRLPKLRGSDQPDTSERDPDLSKRAESDDQVKPFEPALDFGALDKLFAPGVHDVREVFEPKERAIADRLQEEGWRIDARLDDRTVGELRKAEAILRKGPDDEGMVVEFKVPDRAAGDALLQAMQDNDQQRELNEIVIDGRPSGLDLVEVDDAYQQVLEERGRTDAPKIHVILGDGQLVTYPKEPDGES